MTDDVPALEATGEGTFELRGPVTFATAGSLLAAGAARFNGQGSVTVNLGKVTRADSAGLALLLEWLRLGRAAGRPVHFTHLPEKLRAIARLSGVETLLVDGYSGVAASSSSSR